MKALFILLLLVIIMPAYAANMEVFRVITMEGAPRVKTSPNRWAPIMVGADLAASDIVDLSSTDTIVIANLSGETMTLSGQYHFPLSKLSLRRKYRFSPPRQSTRLVTPARVTGSRGAEPDTTLHYNAALYRSPIELYESLLKAVQDGDRAAIQTYFTEECLDDPDFAAYIEVVAGLIQSVDSHVVEVNAWMDEEVRLHAAEKDLVISGFSEWFEAVNISEDGTNYRYRILPEAKSPLKDSLKSHVEEEFDENVWNKANAIMWWVGKFELENKRLARCDEIPGILADSAIPQSLLRDAWGRRFIMEKSVDGRFRIADQAPTGETYVAYPWTTNVLYERVCMELQGIVGAISEFSGTRQRLPDSLAELRTILSVAFEDSNPYEDLTRIFHDKGISMEFKLEDYDSVELATLDHYRRVPAFYSDYPFVTLTDPWGRDYAYERSGDTFRVFTTTSWDATISEWGEHRPRYMILDRDTSKAGRVRFLFRAPADTPLVQLEASFNEWMPIPMRYDQDEKAWALYLSLEPDVYLYRFRSNGVWFRDKENPLMTEEDGLSVLEIK